MPESPEVDALVGFLGEHARGHVVTAVELDEFRALKSRDRPLDEIVGRTVTGARRFGKHAVLDTDGPALLISFGRAGWARWSDDVAAPAHDPRPGAAEIARIAFDGGAELAITDAAEWLSLGLSIIDEAESVPAIAKLGPDPASESFTADALDAVLAGRRKRLKALLQEQESLAGIGGAYSDEILHVARLSPNAHAATLDDEERARLFAAIRDVLGSAFAARRGVPPERLKAEKVASMRVHGRRGEPCPVCGDTVRDIPASKGAAQYCATCQTGGVPLDA